MTIGIVDKAKFTNFSALIIECLQIHCHQNIYFSYEILSLTPHFEVSSFLSENYWFNIFLDFVRNKSNFGPKLLSEF